jgi:hypothetical protein
MKLQQYLWNEIVNSIFGMKMSTVFMEWNCQQYLWNETANSIYRMTFLTVFVEAKMATSFGVYNPTSLLYKHFSVG